jgi:hypothetical protein
LIEEKDNILTLDRSETGGSAASAAATPAPTQPATSKLYPLDWGTTKVPLKGGRFKHKLRRPTSEEIFAREEERHREIEIAKDNSIAMPDPTEGEEIDAKYFDLVIVESEGYNGLVPTSHKAAAFNGLYLREMYIHEDTDIFGEDVPVIEEIGQGDDPDWTIVHTMRQPEESELKRFRRRSSGGKLKPGKRGRQNFVPKSNLKDAVEAYDKWCVRIDGATLTETPAVDLAALKNAVDPLIKRMIVETLVGEIAGNLLD